MSVYGTAWGSHAVGIPLGCRCSCGCTHSPLPMLHNLLFYFPNFPWSTADYGQIKLVAAMMNARQHWFDGTQEGPQGGSGSQPAPAAPTPPAAAAAVGENRPSNGGGSFAAADRPEAKRPRLSSTPQQLPQQQHAPVLDRAAVAGWLAARGGATGPQPLSHFCGCGSQAGQQQQ